MTTTVTPRAAAAALPSYRAGRSAVDAMREHGLAAAIKLASNELPFEPLPSVRDAIRNFDALNRYPDVTSASLRATLAERWQLPGDCVAVGAGSATILWQLASAFLEPTDRLVSPWPSFEAYPLMARIAGAEFAPVELHGCRVDVAELADAAHSAKMLVVAEPNNPTGVALGKRDIRDLISRVPASTLIVIDQAYHEFNSQADDDLLADAALTLPNVVVLRTFSKAHGLAGLRVGFVVGPAEIVNIVQRVAVPFGVNQLGLLAAAASLAEQVELDARVRRVVAERTRVEEALRRLGFGVPVGDANFTWLPAGSATTALATCLEKSGVVGRAVDDFGVRVTIGTDTDNDMFLTAFQHCASDDVARQWTLATGSPVVTMQRLADQHRLDPAIVRRLSSQTTDELATQLLPHTKEHS